MSASDRALADALRVALDQPDEPGVPPAEQAIPIAAERWAEAAAITAALAHHDASERVRVHAVQAWPRLLILGGSGDMIARVAAFRAALPALTADPSPAVRAAAITALFEFAAPHELASLRRDWARFAPDLQGHLDQWKVAAVLPRVLGAEHTRARLEQAAPDRSAPGLAELLLDLEASPDPTLRAALAARFARLPVVTGARAPYPVGRAGGVPMWDAGTGHALLVYRAHLAALPVDDVAPAVALLATASPDLAVILVAELAGLGARGRAVLAAIAASDRTDRDVRRVAHEALAHLAR